MKIFKIFKDLYWVITLFLLCFILLAVVAIYSIILSLFPPY